MILTIELDWIHIACLLLAAGFVVLGTFTALRKPPLTSRSLMSALAKVLLGISLIVQVLSGTARDETGNQILEGWGFLIYFGLLMSVVVMTSRARPESTKEESRQLIRDLTRLYGKKPEESDTMR